MHDQGQEEVEQVWVGLAGAAEGPGMRNGRPVGEHAKTEGRDLTVEQAPSKNAARGTAVEAVGEGEGQATNLEGTEVGEGREASGQTAVAETTWWEGPVEVEGTLWRIRATQANGTSQTRERRKSQRTYTSGQRPTNVKNTMRLKKKIETAMKQKMSNVYETSACHKRSNIVVDES